VPDAESYSGDGGARRDLPPPPARGRRAPRPAGDAAPGRPGRAGHPYDDIDEFYRDARPAGDEGVSALRRITAPLPVIGLAMHGSSRRAGSARRGPGRGEPGAPGGPGGPGAEPGSGGAAGRGGGSGSGGPGDGGRLVWIAGHRWVAALAAGIAVLTVIGAIILILPQHPSRDAAACTGHCGGTSPGTSHGTPRATPARSTPAGSHPARSPSASARASTPPARHSSASPHPTPTRTSPSPKPTRTSPTPKPSATVSVSYTLVHQWHDGFQGQFTINNKGRKTISRWELIAVLSGDQVRWAWPARFQVNGDTLTLQPPPGQSTIAPGASLTENFMADGTTTSPSSCTFDGSPC
jgi:Cellulose binding domain